MLHFIGFNLIPLLLIMFKLKINSIQLKVIKKGNIILSLMYYINLTSIGSFCKCVVCVLTIAQFKVLM